MGIKKVDPAVRTFFFPLGTADFIRKRQIEGTIYMISIPRERSAWKTSNWTYIPGNAQGMPQLSPVPALLTLIS